eukprot:Gb_04678 [translate_table: standard]
MGEHEYMLDEEIGLICKECKFVKMEISNVLPPFRVWKSERSRSREDYVYMDKDFGNIVTPILDYLKGSLPSQSHDLSRNHDSVWKIIPALEKQMNDHQKWGFEFLWRNIAGSLNPKNMKTSCNDVGGCIIAHAPGTGKTFLIISFLQSYLALFPRCKPLIVAPKSMLHTWKREFKKWNVNIPIYILNSLRDHRKKESPLTKDYKVPFRQLYNIYCMTMLHEWHKKESVLLISYSQFFHFTNEENDKLSEETRKIGRLLKGSPGILILDEGHIPRSHDSKIWNLLMRVNTNLRILLSGTLFQNNFEEYFNTLCLARPTFVDRILQRHPTLSHVSTFGKHSSREMEDMLKEKVARRYFLDEIAKRIRTGTRKERSECYHKLKSMTEDFIDVYKGEVLNELPGLTTYTVMLRPTLLQEILLEKIDESISKENGSSLELEIMISMASIHPSIVKDLSFIGKYSGIDICKLETFRKNPEEGIKLKFVIDLVGLCRDKGEKVLIFCQHLPPLYLLEEIFESHLNWYKDKEILLLTGNLSLDERQDIIDKFNKIPGDARVLLASIKACGVGVSLTEASRVILLDLVWNPSCTKQAIGRAFRIGQKKFVYVYQLVAFGTMEEEKYDKTVWKEWLSSLIFVGGNCQYVEPLRIKDDILTQLVERDRDCVTFRKIYEQKEIQKNKRKRDINDILHFETDNDD